MGKIIGIDLGTTNSVVAIMEGREPKVIVNEEGSRITPSVVAWDEKGEVLVGQIAKRQAVTNPENTIFSAKRFIGPALRRGRRGDEARPLQGRARQERRQRLHRARQGGLSPQEVSAQVLLKLKKAAEDYLGEKVTEAVITVPAYFNDAQRQATKDAGRIAGLDVKRIVNEPTAAALAYGLDKKKDEIIAVYDFGGGTFDISILEVGDNVVQVISTNGDTHLGGDDIDNLDHRLDDRRVQEDAAASTSRKDKMALQRLKEAAEKAKIELSSVQETSINLPFLTVGPGGPVHLDMRLSRAKLEQMIGAARRALDGAGHARRSPTRRSSPKDIDEVVLVGGSTRIPLVKETVKKFFGKEPHQGVNPDEVVAIGAAVQAGVLSGDVKDMVLLDVTPLSLGVETLGGVMTTMIPRNTTIPTQKKEIFSTATDSQPSVEIHVLQGERTEARYNRTLGKFHLEGIMPAPRGVPKVEVTFDIDANGILSRPREGHGDGQGPEDHHHGELRPERGRDPEDGEGGRRSTRPRTRSAASRSSAGTSSTTSATRSKRRSPRTRTSSRRPTWRRSRASSRRARGGREAGRRARCRTSSSASRRKRTASPSVMYGAAGAAGRPTAGRCRRRRPGRRRRRAAGGDKKKDGGVIDAEFEETGG